MKVKSAVFIKSATSPEHYPRDGRPDLLMKEWLSERGMPFVIVATKADKLSSNQLRTNLSRASAVLGKENPIIAYSAITRSGADRLWKEITTRVADFGSGKPLVKPSGTHAD